MGARVPGVPAIAPGVRSPEKVPIAAFHCYPVSSTVVDVCFSVWSGLRRCFSAALVSGLVSGAGFGCSPPPLCFFFLPLDGATLEQAEKQEKQRRRRGTTAVQTRLPNI